MKPCNSSDRINLNRIPHPEDTDHMLSCSLETDEDYVAVVSSSLIKCLDATFAM